MSSSPKTGQPPAPPTRRVESVVIGDAKFTADELEQVSLEVDSKEEQPELSVLNPNLEVQPEVVPEKAKKETPTVTSVSTPKIESPPKHTENISEQIKPNAQTPPITSPVLPPKRTDAVGEAPQPLKVEPSPLELNAKHKEESLKEKVLPEAPVATSLPLTATPTLTSQPIPPIAPAPAIDPLISTEEEPPLLKPTVISPLTATSPKFVTESKPLWRKFVSSFMILTLVGVLTLFGYVGLGVNSIKSMAWRDQSNLGQLTSDKQAAESLYVRFKQAKPLQLESKDLEALLNKNSAWIDFEPSPKGFTKKIYLQTPALGIESISHKEVYLEMESKGFKISEGSMLGYLLEFISPYQTAEETEGVLSLGISD